MINKLALMSLLTVALWGADSDFNGRWNIDVKTPRGRVWWLEVEGAGTGKVTGSFVGAPGGQVDRIEGMRVENGELVFSFERKPALKQTFRARFDTVNGVSVLRGTREEVVDGKSSPVLSWTAERAPVLREKDDGTWKPARTVALFDGKSTAGWHLLIPGQPDWHVEDGLLKNHQGAADLVSEARFWNMEVRAEFRYAKGSNSGVALRGRYEIQIHDNFGKPPDLHGTGALYSRIVPSVNASKAPGEWQTMVMRLVGRELTVTLNGTKVIDRREVEGPTAMVMSPKEDTPGPIVLQGDHGLVEFRTLQVVELVNR
jgi:hypothetical protein